MIIHFWHFLLHFFGIDTQQSYAYDYWSGFGTQLNLPVLAAIFMFIRHRNCHVKGCRAFVRTAPDPKHNWYACRRHHSQAHQLGRSHAR